MSEGIQGKHLFTSTKTQSLKREMEIGSWLVSKAARYRSSVSRKASLAAISSLRRPWPPKRLGDKRQMADLAVQFNRRDDSSGPINVLPILLPESSLEVPAGRIPAQLSEHFLPLPRIDPYIQLVHLRPMTSSRSNPMVSMKA